MRIPKSLIFFAIFLILLISVTTWAGSKIKHALDRRNNPPPPQVALEELTITTIEGWTVKDIANYLDKQGIVPAEIFLSAQEKFDGSKYTFWNSIPKEADLEGFLFPDTYRIVKGSESNAIITKMLNNFANKLETATAQSRLLGSRYIIPGYEKLILEELEQPGLTLYELITLASIVEKEAGGFGSSTNPEKLLQERKTVAGIFLNRLSINQALESDATINYFTNSGRARSTEGDLAINSPYNTYKYRGLPPGPIGNPSLASLQAVLDPIETDYYFFFHTQPEGSIIYSKTFEEHRDKKARLLK